LLLPTWHHIPKETFMMREPQVEGRAQKSERLRAHRSSPSYIYI
jgi:hypothetical protein